MRFLLVLAGLASTAGAQLQYDRTTFLPGLGDPNRWFVKSTPERLAGQVDFGVSGFRRIGPSSTLAPVSDQSSSIRGQIVNTGQNVLVGHSMGGVVARDLLVNPNAGNNAAGNIAAIVTLGSPHHGAPISANYGRIDVKGRLLIDGFFFELATGILNPVGALISAAFRAIINWLIETVVNNLLKFAAGQFTGINSAGSQDLKPGSPTIARLSTTLDSRPHVTVNGVIPKRDAAIHLASSYLDWHAPSIIRSKDAARTGLRICKAMFYNFIIKTGTGRACHLADRTIGGLDDRWNEWTHGSNRNAPFDGLIPDDHSRYPGSAVGSVVNLVANGVNHFSIVDDERGLSRLRTGMFQIGMRSTYTGDPGDGGGGGGGGGGGCDDPESCLQYSGKPSAAPPAKDRERTPPVQRPRPVRTR